jgi:hypothetical protein
MVLAVLCAVGGCGDKHKRPPMAAVSGTVTFNGEPVGDATVQFQLADGSAPRLSTGMTDAGGNFTLTTYNTDDGAFIGSNLVAIIKTQMGSGKEMTAADLAAMHGNPPVFKLLPEKFADPKTSGLKYEVESGDNKFDIKLKE